MSYQIYLWFWLLWNCFINNGMVDYRTTFPSPNLWINRPLQVAILSLMTLFPNTCFYPKRHGLLFLGIDKDKI